jgi:putative ABC transport system substrate-binding protein
MVTRRAFLWAAGGVLAAPRLLAQAQKKNVVVLFSGEEEDDEPASRPYFEEMRRLGWNEGQNITYERFYGRGTRDYMENLARAAAGREIDLIYATTTGLALTLVKEGSSTPVVFTSAAHPVRAGLVKSLDKPGGNATGAFTAVSEIVRRRLQLAREAFPRFRQIGILIDRRAPDYPRQKLLHEQDGRRVGFAVSVAEFTNFEAVAKALATFRRAGIGLVCITPSVTLTGRRREVAELAAIAKLGLVAHRSEWAEAGALMTFGADVAEALQRSARISNRVLRGAKPGDIPVEQATKLELAVNAKSAAALGLQIPAPLWDRADRKIE